MANVEFEEDGFEQHIQGKTTRGIEGWLVESHFVKSRRQAQALLAIVVIVFLLIIVYTVMSTGNTVPVPPTSST